MDALSSWQKFLRLQANQCPLVFSHGLRHPVARHDYCPEHAHFGLEIVYHPSGTGITCIDGTHRVSFTEGSVIIYAPRQRHDQRVETDGEDLCVQILSKRPNPPFPSEHLYLPTVEDPAIAEDILLLSKRSTSLTPSDRAVLNYRVTATLLALVTQYCNSWERSGISRAERYVRQAERYIQEHFAEIDSLTKISEPTGIGADHLRHLFKAQRGKSLIRYINELRLERAKTLLVHSRLPLKQIATLCGFRDEYYFSAVFRKFHRMPPRRYRETYW